MLNLVVYAIVYFLEMLISYIVFSTVSDKKKTTFCIFLIGFFIYESGAIINFICHNTIWVNSIYTLSSMFAFAVICFQIKYKSAAVYVILMSIFSAALEFATIFVVSVLAGTDITEYNSNLSLLLIEALISKTLYLLACMALIYVPQRKTSMDKIPPSFYLLPVSILFSLISFWYICAHEQLSNTNQMLLSISSIVLLSSTVLLFIIYRHSIEKENEYIRVKSEFDRLQIEKAYYDILEHQNQQLMIYAHDAKNHLSAIQSLNTDPCIDEYIKKLSEQLGNYAQNCHSGNMILDVIINKYVTECSINGIRFDYDIRENNLICVEDIDLVSILGNLLDNALTAAKKSEKKHMSLATTTRNSYSVVIIHNSFDEEPIVYGEYLMTTKEDSKLHGFGLRSVKKTLKKYQGDLSWEFDSDSHLFVTTVMIGEKE